MSEDNKINGEWIVIFNVLALLREKPMTYEELMKSGCFKSERHLEFALRRLTQSCCIEKIKAVGIYCILGHGITLLSFYPTWRPIPLTIIDTVVPIGEH